MSKSLKFICTTALGIALYVALSMTAKIPIIGHIGLDLGYIVLAVYCYVFGPVSGAMVGGAGCVLVSLLSSGWFPPGWLLGNVFIGTFCGWLYVHSESWDIKVANVIVTIISVAFGILVCKTIVECVLYSIPVLVKAPKNAIAAAMDAVVMSIGVLLAPRLEAIKK